MVKTASTMATLGSQAPDFSLINVDGRTVSRSDFAGRKGLLVIFMCNHCPFVKHVAGEFTRLANDYLPKGLAIVGINSNDAATHPEDSPERMIHEVEERGYPFPYLYDETQEVAQAYKAACTPDFFLYDARQRLSIAASSTTAAHPTAFLLPAATCGQRSMSFLPASSHLRNKRRASAATSSGRRAPSRFTTIR
ncbi:MAG TPA: thioredoxin family protein [Pirellulaceae bacterium]|nr:thioredoxin family protein [Pirellulaceae bacterium]